MLSISEACREYQRQRLIQSSQKADPVEVGGIACLFAGITSSYSFIPAIVGTSCFELIVPREDRSSLWQIRSAKCVGICSGEIARQAVSVAAVSSPGVSALCVANVAACCFASMAVCVAHKSGCFQEMRAIENTIETIREN